MYLVITHFCSCCKSPKENIEGGDCPAPPSHSCQDDPLSLGGAGDELKLKGEISTRNPIVA